MLKSEIKINTSSKSKSATIKQEYELYCDFCYVEHESLSDLNSCLQRQLASIKQESNDEMEVQGTQHSYESINDFGPLTTCITKEEETINQSEVSHQTFLIKQEASFDYKDQPQQIYITKDEKNLDQSREPMQQFEEPVKDLHKTERLKTAVQYFHCIKCDKNYKSKKTLGVHMKIHEAADPIDQKVYICDFCGKSFEVRKGVLEHLRFHLNGHHSCNFCDAEFMLKSSLNRHIQKKHSTSHGKTNQELICEHCDKRFQYKESLKFHLNTHRSLSLFTCKDCHKPFNSSGALKQHQLSQHSSELNFECKVCWEKFSSYSKLVCHRKKHSRKIGGDNLSSTSKSSTKNQPNQEPLIQESDFPCTECDKKFAKKKYLRDHFKRVHTD